MTSFTVLENQYLDIDISTGLSGILVRLRDLLGSGSDNENDDNADDNDDSAPDDPEEASSDSDSSEDDGDDADFDNFLFELSDGSNL